VAFFGPFRAHIDLGIKEGTFPSHRLSHPQSNPNTSQHHSQTLNTAKMVHIIGFAQSTCTQRVLTTLAEKGVTDYTMFAPDFMKGALKVDTPNGIAFSGPK